MLRTAKKSITNTNYSALTAATVSDLVSNGYLQWVTLPVDMESKCNTNDEAGFYCDLEHHKMVVIQLNANGECINPNESRYNKGSHSSPDLEEVNALQNVNPGLNFSTNVECKLYERNGS